jgi:tyrosine-protein kinase Etk/Wzc
MENFNKNIKIVETKSFKDYFILLRTNIFPVLLIVIFCTSLAVYYSTKKLNIYQATASFKISKSQGNILANPGMTDMEGFVDDRFISTEIEIMKSHSIRKLVAQAIVDSLRKNYEPDNFYLIVKHSKTKTSKPDGIYSTEEITGIIAGVVSISQRKGIDIIDITVESPSPYEAAFIANCYAYEYVNFNLDVNRKILTDVKEFLSSEAKEKQNELALSEDNLSTFQAQKGVIALDAQSQNLISQLSGFEAQRENVKIELLTASRTLGQLKDEIKKQDPKIADYLESLASQDYYQELQSGIAKMEVTRDLAVMDKSGNNGAIVSEYDKKIKELKDKLNSKLDLVKLGVYANNPELIKSLSAKVFDTEIRIQSLTIQSNELNNLVGKYESQFNKMPKTSIEYARLERKRESDEKLYSLLEDKYQEAKINELSQPGNVVMIDQGVIPTSPAKPDRRAIDILGFFIGLGLAFGYVMIKNYFDNTIKTPEDIQKKNINVLAWIPQIEGISDKDAREFEFIVSKKPDSIPSEAFRALRTRIQYSKIGNDVLKTILITSAAPQEGKTTISVNLAGTFAQSNKKTLIVDVDLRKPRLHSVFKVPRYPGLIDYLVGNALLEEIIRPTDTNNLSFISAGTIPPNPSEMIESKAMQDFISNMRKRYDVVIFDSAPIIAVTDSEIFASLVDASILVVSSEKTEFELMEKAAELIKRGSTSFIGAVLNNFTYKSGYGSYYKYYYYYSHPTNGKNTKSNKKVSETKYI